SRERRLRRPWSRSPGRSRRCRRRFWPRPGNGSLCGRSRTARPRKPRRRGTCWADSGWAHELAGSGSRGPEGPGRTERAIPEAAERELRAPMTGRVVKVAATAGAAVEAGQILVILEAMKMEYRIVAPRDGTVEMV